MKKIIIITGANRGLGKAIVDLGLKKENTVVISLSRSLHEEHKHITTDKLVFIRTDLSEPFSDVLFQEMNKCISSDSILYFFNNASIILPIAKIGSFNEENIETALKVNLQFPVNLINGLLNNFHENSKVLINITSGAGYNPVPYWSLYGASKAYMKMFFSVLREENKHNPRIQLYSIDPGVLDTEMQETIRKNTAPKQYYFKTLKEENRLIKPTDAAISIFEEINY